METYQSPRLIELGTIAEFTRGDRFAWQFDGMSLAEAIDAGHITPNGHITNPGALGTS